MSTEGVQGLSNFGFPPPYSLSHNYYLIFSHHCQVLSLGGNGFSSNRVQTLTDAPTLTQSHSLILHIHCLTSGVNCQVFSLGFLRGYSEVLIGIHSLTSTYSVYQEETQMSSLFCTFFGRVFGTTLAIAKSIPSLMVWFLQGPLRFSEVL